MKKYLLILSFFFLLFSSLKGYSDTVNGKIVQSDNSIVSGARVTFYSRHPQFRKSVNTDKNGYFSISELPSGYYNIEIAAKGFCREYVTRFEVNEAKLGILSPTFNIYKPGSVSGYVYDDKDRPLSGIKVNNTTTNSKGFYTIYWLRPGPVYLTASSKKYVREHKSTTILENKNRGGINFTLKEGGSVSGKIISKETGKPLKNVTVNSWGKSYGDATTDANGFFIIEGLAEGEHQLNAYIQGYENISDVQTYIKKKQIVEIPTIKMALRPESFNLYDRNRVFTESEKVFVLYNSFRVKKCGISIFRVDNIKEEIQKLPAEVKNKKVGGNISQAIKYIDTRELSCHLLYKKDFEINYPSPLSDIYDKKFEIGPLPIGTYIVVSKPENLPEQKHFLTVTDLSLISRTDKDKTILYACDINRGTPLKEVEISLLDRNLDTTQKGVTDKNGLFEIEGKYHRIVATKGSSYASLSYDYYHQDLSKRYTYLYTDRPVYRPEQTVYFKGITREATNGSYEISKSKKKVISIQDPQGNNIHKKEVEVSPAGSFYGSFTLSEEPPLGSYTISCGESSSNFKVLEYRKPDYLIKITPDKSRYLPNETINVSINAQYYFGSPVKEAEVHYSVYEKPSTSFYDEHLEEYYYGWGYGTQVLAGKGITDDKGNLEIKIPLKNSYDAESVYTIEARVVDSSRREVKSTANTIVVPGTFKIDIGIQKNLYKLGEDIPIQISVTDYENIPIPQKNLNFYAGIEVYKNKKILFTEFLKRELFTDEDGKKSIKITPTRAGYTKIFIQSKDEKNNLITSNKYIWITDKDTPFGWSGQRQMEIVLDKDIYKAGDTVQALINSSVANIPLLISLESSKIYNKEVVKLNGNTGLFEFKLKEEHIPNVYITVAGVKDKKYYTSSRIIKLSSEEHLLKVDIESDREQYLPGEKVSYLIKTKDFKDNPTPAEFSFGLVDESIYSISGELAPKIEDFFYGTKPLNIGSSYSFYEWLYAGAGKDLTDENIRRNFKDTAYWNPIIMTDNQGRASLEVTLPDNLTTWRATVKSATLDTKVGTSTQKIISTKPLIVRLITPRFLVEYDRLFITGVIHNYTEEDLLINANLSVDGIKVLDPSTREKRIPAGKEWQINWQVKVEGEKEKAVIQLRATAGKEKDAMEITLPIYIYGEEVFQVKRGEIAPSSSDSFFIPVSAILPTIDLKTIIYPSLASGLFRNLDYLAEYPYGCIEQTMSRFIPLIYLNKVIKEVGIKDLSFLAEDETKFKRMLEEMPQMVNIGLSRIYASQNTNGGWGWWSNDSSRSYISAYVLYGLSITQKAGYEVNPECVKRVKDFLKEKINDVENINEKTYILFALTQAEEFNKTELEEIYKKRAEINSYSLALLTLIYAEQKENKRATQLLEELYKKRTLLSKSISYWKTERTGYYGWTNNDVEATAWALKATLAVAPDNKEAVEAVRYLLWREKSGYWRSTKDTAICVFALADFLKTRDELSPNYLISLSVNEKRPVTTTVTDDTLKNFSSITKLPVSALDIGKENKVKLSKEGKGRAYYSHNLKYFTRTNFIKPKDEGFKVEREYFLYKKDINDLNIYKEPQEKFEGTVKVGEIIMVKISVIGKEGYQYVMVEDMLPAGCEVVEHQQDNWYTKKEVRDEKVAFFDSSFGEYKKEFYYFLRAETPGRYHILPTKASMMYLPEFWGQSSESFLTITEK
ncbi:carboxypeptidase regulatory-like domain-containing protein [bacterium]|nr:carboxypeptidase regulatory-like domain-containing protein [bacterium]